MLPLRVYPLHSLFLCGILLLLLCSEVTNARSTPRVNQPGHNQSGRGAAANIKKRKLSRKERAAKHKGRFMTKSMLHLPEQEGGDSGRYTRLFPHEQDSLVILGISGGLGSQIAREALKQGRHRVSGMLRSTQKAHNFFTKQELQEMHFFEGNIDVQNASQTRDFLENMFRITQADVVVEVLSNNLRPDGIDIILAAAALAKVSTVVVTGGAGNLFTSEAEMQVLDEKGARVGLADDAPDWLVDVTKLHLEVQKRAFSMAKNFVIPTVFQITPPGMEAGENSGNYELTRNVAKDGSMDTVTYGDTAAVLLEALRSPSEYNMKMVGVAKTAQSRRSRRRSSRTEL